MHGSLVPVLRHGHCVSWCVGLPQRESVMSTFEDQQEDSELRIAAYLAVMTCPDDFTLQRVQRVLEAETDQQVRMRVDQSWLKM